MLDFGVSWNHYLCLVKFAYNSSYQAMIGMDLYEALYGQKCRLSVGWLEVK